MVRPSLFRFWKFIVAALSLAVFSIFLIQKYSDVFIATPDRRPVKEIMIKRKPVDECPTTFCPADHFSFFIQSGAADAVPPKICFQNELVLGMATKNHGVGINVVLINGKTGAAITTEHHDMWAGDVAPLIELLKKIETGTIVLMASYDEPATRLTQEARELILDLGSSMIKTVEFRDNWIFVGGKGANIKSAFEKVIKHAENDVYQGWPEIIDIGGCIPKYIGS